MSTATAERGHCAPENGPRNCRGDTALPDYGPSDLRGEANTIRADDSGKLRAGVRVRLRDDPNHAPKTIIGVVTEVGLEGTMKLLRLAWMAPGFGGIPRQHSFLINPGLVFIRPEDNEPPKTLREVLQDAAVNGFAVFPQVSKGEGNPVGIAWGFCGPQRKVSSDGRFVITWDETGVTAHDKWTGEEVSRLATHFAAENWCACRLEVPPLTWSPRPGGGFLGQHNQVVFEVYSSIVGWHGIDPRISSVGLSSHLRTSGPFPTPQEAQAWCAVRAACKVSGGDKGAKSLRYEDPLIPF